MMNHITWIKPMLFAIVVTSYALGADVAGAGSAEKVLAALDVAPVWSTHHTGTPVLLTRSEYQYVLYYDKDRHVALAQRKLASDTWSYHTFPEVLGWATGGHCNLSMAVDVKGCPHVSSYNRGFAKTHAGPIYYRSGKPHDLSAWTKPAITTVPVPCYPTFVSTGPQRRGSVGRASSWHNWTYREKFATVLPMRALLQADRSGRCQHRPKSDFLSVQFGNIFMLLIWTRSV